MSRCSTPTVTRRCFRTRLRSMSRTRGRRSSLRPLAQPLPLLPPPTCTGTADAVRSPALVISARRLARVSARRSRQHRLHREAARVPAAGALQAAVAVEVGEEADDAEAVMTFDLKASVDVLERTPRVLQEMLGGIDAPWPAADEGPDT